MRASASAEQLYDLERQVRALAEEVDEARRIIPELRALVADVAASAVEINDERMNYVVVQIDRSTWEALTPAVEGARR